MTQRFLLNCVPFDFSSNISRCSGAAKTQDKSLSVGTLSPSSEDADLLIEADRLGRHDQIHSAADLLELAPGAPLASQTEDVSQTDLISAVSPDL
jgi:hypothetical protein